MMESRLLNKYYAIPRLGQNMYDVYTYIYIYIYIMKNFLVHKQTLKHQSNLLVEKGINVAKTGKNG